MSRDAWLVWLCLPETTTPARLRALLHDERARISQSPCPMVSEASAIRCAAWKADVAEALGWSQEAIAHAYRETPAGLGRYLREACEALEGIGQ